MRRHQASALAPVDGAKDRDGDVPGGDADGCEDGGGDGDGDGGRACIGGVPESVDAYRQSLDR